VDVDFDVFGAIAEAGGPIVRAADRVLVLRKIPNTQEVAVVRVSLAAAKRDATANLRLAPGDVVSVEQTPATVLEETVNRLLRVGVNPLTGF
jgi:polysaccharide export outer membrane protein